MWLAFLKNLNESEMIGVATLVISVASIVVVLLLHWSNKRIVPPVFSQCSLTAQLGHHVMYVDVDADEKLTHAYGFPTIDNPMFRPENDVGPGTQAPVFEFLVSNHGSFEILIRAAFIEVTEHSVPEVAIGDGPLYGGSIIRYECVIRGKKGLYPADLKRPGLDYVSVTPGASEPISIYVRSRDPGAYRMRPVIKWSASWKSNTVKVDCGDKRIVFFANVPPSYVKAQRAKT